MKKKLLFCVIALSLIITSFQDTTTPDEAVLERYDELVAEFMEKEKRACQQAAKEEAILTWSGSADGGEEASERTRLSKTKGE
jgi:hypothetical protein